MAATKLYINVAAPAISQSLVRSPTDLTPVAFPELVLGDGRAYELYFVDGLGGYAPFSGDGSFIPYIAIGSCGFPGGGTAIWTFSGQNTSPLAYNVSPAALQAALEALSNIGSGNVSVAGVAGRYYVITFQGTMGGMAQPEITVDFDGLTPASTVDITTVVAGGTAVDAVQLATLAVNPLSFADDWTPITNGWTGQLSSRTVEVFEAFAAAGGTLSEVFQVTVADADGVRTTYAKVAASIQCTIISPESFAGADKPLLATQAALNAAVLGLGNFTRESLSSSAAGNTNVARPAAASRHHLARLTLSGVAGSRTVSLLTTNSPNPGDVILLAVLPAAVEGYAVDVYNSTTAGTLLASFVTTDSGVPYFLLFSWNGSAWEIDETSAQYLSKAENLAGLTDTVAAKANLRALFGQILDVSGDTTLVIADEGKLVRVDASGGPVAITLPAANSVSPGFLFGIQKFDSGPQVVTTVPGTKTLAAAGASAVIQSDGNNWNVVLSYDPTGITPTLAEVVENREALSSLALIRAQATAAGAVATNAAWFVSAGQGGVWVLEDDTSADNGISVLRPNDYDGTTNPRTWHLRLRGVPALLAAGQMFYFNGTNLVVIPAGTAGQVLTEVAGVPTWQTSPTQTAKNEQTLTSGNITISPTTAIHSEIITIAGAARTSVVFLDDLSPAADGWIANLRFNFPTTPGIIVQVKDLNSGTLLVAFSSDDGGGVAFSAFLEALYVEGGGGGQDWKALFVISPTV